MVDFVAAVAEESRRFAEAVSRVGDHGDPAEVRVPSCPDWSVDDLVWHLTEVQHFWASIVAGRLRDPGQVVPLDRRPGSQLVDGFIEASSRLEAELGRADPDEACWSWYGAGQRVGWVRRRQANEALIHRIDAELALAAAGGPIPTPIDPGLAADGVDEMLVVMLGVDPLPAWATWAPDGAAVRIVADDGAVGTDGDGGLRSWLVRFGRFSGTQPGDGSGVEPIEHDLAAVRVDPVDEGSSAVDASVSGPAAAVDLWLWGRGGLDQLAVDGDAGLAEGLRGLAVFE